MKAVGILDYGVEDVFHIFIRKAKKDFPDFNEEDATGCKLKKNIETGGKKPVECTVEITEYTRNEKYQITTTTSLSNCVSTYTFKEQKDGKTKLILEEKQSSDKFISYLSLYIQRFMSRRNFKIKYKYIIDSLNNEIKTYFANIDRSAPKDKVITN